MRLRFTTMVAMGLLIGTPFARANVNNIHAVKFLAGYACMSLAKLWDGVGPQPPLVHVYVSPATDAAVAGIAGGSLIVQSPMVVENGRAKVLFPNGRVVWVGTSDIVRWHAVSDPSATCVPVLLSNGRYGFHTNP